MVTILMMSEKLAKDLLKIKVFWKKNYDVMIFVHNVTNKILSRDSNYIVDGVMWLKFDDSNIFRREVIINSFFEGWYWLKFNKLGLALGMALKFYSRVAKGLKLKVKKIGGLIPTFVEVTEGNWLVGFLLPSWIGLNKIRTWCDCILCH